MSTVEMALMLGFGVPIVLLCCAFVLCAGWMQIKEEQQTPNHQAR
ncbi:MAG: hypothetical protein Q4F18_08035 [Clostridia bacterium]|nr:hypothetical protein [Clostridia bacterium]